MSMQCKTIYIYTHIVARFYLFHRSDKRCQPAGQQPQAELLPGMSSCSRFLFLSNLQLHTQRSCVHIVPSRNNLLYFTPQHFISHRWFAHIQVVLHPSIHMIVMLCLHAVQFVYCPVDCTASCIWHIKYWLQFAYMFFSFLGFSCSAAYVMTRASHLYYIDNLNCIHVMLHFLDQRGQDL